MAVRRLGAGPSRRLGRAGVLARERRLLDHLHVVRAASRRAGRAGLPRVVLRGGRVRTLGRWPAADRVRMGDRRAATPRTAWAVARSGSGTPWPRRLGNARERLGVDGIRI